jgi:hypothetical protein
MWNRCEPTKFEPILTNKLFETIQKAPTRSRAVGDFYGTGIEIWAGFGPVWQLLRLFFSCFHGQKIN